MSSNSKHLIIGNVYRPPNSNAEIFNHSLSTTLDIINKEKKTCYLLGDFNFNLLNKDSHSATNEFPNCLNTHFFFPTIRKPTRVTDRTATLIDNIIFNSLNYNTKSGVLYADISDHFPIFHIFELNKDPKKTQKAVYTYRNFNAVNKRKFVELLNNVSFDNVYIRGVHS